MSVSEDERSEVLGRTSDMRGERGKAPSFGTSSGLSSAGGR